jgi:DNA-binding CsgD family transcriptional regulator
MCRAQLNLGCVATSDADNGAGQRHIRGFELIPSGGARLGTPVDLLGCYSKRTSWIKRVQQLPEPTFGDHASAVRRPRATVTTLRAAEVEALVRGYRSGASLNDLAARFGIHRTTVTQHLRRNGVTIRRRGLDDRQIQRAISLYRQGNSLALVGARLGVHAETVRQALRARGIQMRDSWERI